MRVGNLYKNQSDPSVSFEFFPPRDDKAESSFYGVVDALSALNPAYMSMTFGAGGSTSEGSFQAVKRMMIEKNLPMVAYIAGYGLGPHEITEVLDRYKALGVETIFVIRGDKPRTDGFTPHPESFAHASDLIRFISDRYDFDLGCAGYPEGHVQAESLEKDVEYLRLKQDNGAQYVVAQYFYDNDSFYRYVDLCRKSGITIPIIPGIMPIYTVKLTRMLCKLCGSTLPTGLREKLDSLTNDKSEAVADLGVNFAFDQCRDLVLKGVDGLHFYTMDRSGSVLKIVQRLKDDGLFK
ncbi:MetF1 [Desulforapulum autotrophicum HRM2]|uniref:Methylenetetrahydrofolate reductase n=1 Tax=Desulforapulum autotrophicum (strain ATCC 43914 / DSM 3382 / VKM B-1955 / HRM2) TaxID=177437 RepID=C0QAY2_DESAH|nr:methylenetetrahydrofolate reductase [Desulforapulum autotrophicum]ACN14781.1 MetF1 [Desulforapulum autotrophicum HRM2]